MSRKLFGVIGITGALLLWTSVAGLAHGPRDAEGTSTAGQADANAALQTLATCHTDLSALTTAGTGKNPEQVKELIDSTTEAIAEIRSETADHITSALEDFQEALSESQPEDQSPDDRALVVPTEPDFAGMAKAACDQIAALIASTQATIAGLPAFTPPKADADDEHETRD